MNRNDEQPRESDFAVALVSMPWPLCNRPSIQLGTLKAYLCRVHPWIRVSALHPYLQLAAALGTSVYHQISQSMWLAEALSAPLVHPRQTEAVHRLVRGLARKRQLPSELDIISITARLEENVSYLLTAANWEQVKLAGFSICTGQLFSTLAAARALKEKWPHLLIVVGGSTCSGAMVPGLRELGMVDYLIQGEGEETLAELCAYLAGKKNTLPAGIWDIKHGETCNNGAISLAEPKPPMRQIKDLNSLPHPDYNDYFQQLRCHFPQPFIPIIPVEFSRGCWWAKCTFCNLNRQWHGYRAKSSPRMVAEILALSHRFACLDFSFMDNVLPQGKALAFFRAIGREQKGFSFFAEMRASQRTLFPELSRHGVRTIQVGIEALSSELLRRMGKGETVMENVAALKEAQENGIALEGNIITEFPGSSEEDVAQTMAVLDYLLPFSPLTAAAFFLGQGSAVDCEPRRFGIDAIIPHRYAAILLPREVARRLPFVVKEYRGGRVAQRKMWRPVREKIAAWWRFHEKRSLVAHCSPPLSFRDGGDFLLIRQEREDGSLAHHRLKGLSREIYLSCRKPCRRDHLLPSFPAVTAARLEAFLQDLCGKRILFHHDGTYLALAVAVRKMGNQVI